MDNKYINLNPDNLAGEHLCCLIRSKAHQGIDTKRRGLADRLAEGHIFRKLDVKGTAFIEYSPLEKAWTPVIGSNYFYIYCLWVSGQYKGYGYGKSLLEYCLNEARNQAKSGVCMLGSKKQKSWLSDKKFALKYGFEVVDETGDGYELLALSFDGTKPSFTERAREQRIDSEKLTIYYGPQCPYIPHFVNLIENYCQANDVPVDLIKVDTLKKAKALPGVFNNWAVFYQGRFETVNLLDEAYLSRILKKSK